MPNHVAAPDPSSSTFATPSECRRPIVRIVAGDSSTSLKYVLERAGFGVVAEYAFVPTVDPANDAPCCLMIDVRRLPGSSEVSDLERHFGMPIIVLVPDRTDLRVVVELMRRGAFNVLERPLEQISKIVSIVAEAVAYGAERRLILHRKKQVGDALATLPEGEREVLGYIIDGFPNKQIAGRLGIALRTVEARRSRIMRRLSVNSLAELVRAVTDQNTKVAEQTSARAARPSVLHGPHIDFARSTSEQTCPVHLG